jgi:arylsulfatase A-like enzyme
VTTATPRRLGPLDVLVLAAWCGLAGGLLEVGTRVVCKLLPEHRMYGMSRHFIWMGPLSSLLLISGVGLLLALATRCWPRRGAWLSARLAVFLAVLPVLFVVSSRIYPSAWVVVAIGISSRLVPIFERHPAEARRWLLWSFPALVSVVVILAGIMLGGDWLKERREESRPLPSGAPPNVLLIVMDTVRADHLSLYGYRLPTSPTLERLARRGIRFDEARATAPWTLPSHASMFTGRWPHELGVTWRVSPETKFTTLAEYLGSRGYATTGFVANLEYCSHEFGLDRGFAHYEDYVLEPLAPLRMCMLGDLVLKGLYHLGWNLSASLGAVPFLPHKDSPVWRILNGGPRLDADMINREFLGWLSRRREPERPFFAFLNYFDAHSSYMLPPGNPYRFGRPPKTDADVHVLVEWMTLDKLKLGPYYHNLARDCYDSCISHLDKKLGELFDELERRGILDHTLVIVTSDHGEGLGEHDLFFHGESLYRTEIRVPLLIVSPGQDRPANVSETISLRDLPATIVDLAGQGAGSPFPGRSLAGLWRDPHPTRLSAEGGGAISELPGPNPSDPNQGRAPIHRGALTSIAEADYVYIRNEGDGSEELFNQRDDPNEVDNRARSESARDIKERLRTQLDLLLGSTKMSATMRDAPPLKN